MATKQKKIKEAKKGSPHTRGQNPLPKEAPKEAENDEAMMKSDRASKKP